MTFDAPIGGAERLFSWFDGGATNREGSSGAEDRFTVESVTSPSGLTHQLWNKNDHV